ncbi:MAG: polyribonucleotide nucleotidyltransferase, partial [Deltaproteobacteria bacterium]|nr:polyribonucleotide nucleotidyltransferase [Deltaproteobacteria bacterium]
MRVGLIDGERIFNPSNSERDISDLDLVVVGTEDAIVMVEAASNQLSEEIVLDSIFAAHRELQPIIRAQHEMFRELGLSKPEWDAPQIPTELVERIRGDLKDSFR